LAQAMKFACKKFEGDHDFSNFCKMDAASVHNYRRTISNFDILPTNEE
jgi:tRNA pseudouridine38/39 synthase